MRRRYLSGGDEELREQREDAPEEDDDPQYLEGLQDDGDESPKAEA